MNRDSSESPKASAAPDRDIERLIEIPEILAGRLGCAIFRVQLPGCSRNIPQFHRLLLHSDLNPPFRLAGLEEPQSSESYDGVVLKVP